MKSFTRFVIVAGSLLLGASTAHASGLRLTPPHPAAGQSFTVEFDYTTTCLSGLEPPYTPFARLEPADPSVDMPHVGVASFLRCFDILPPYSVHISTPMSGLAAGSYPIYSEVNVLNGVDPPFIRVTLEGNVTVGALPSSAVPALSPLSLLLLTLGTALASMIAWRARKDATDVR